MINVNLYLADQRSIRVECDRGYRHGESVLRICRSLAVFARDDQLEQIRGAIDAYLHERRRPVPAEAATEWLPKEFPAGGWSDPDPTVEGQVCS